MLKSRYLLNTLLSLGISLFLLALLIHGVDGTADLAIRPKLYSVLTRTAWNALLLYMLASVVQTFFRAIRYRVLLKSSLTKDEELPSLFYLFIVTMSRNMFIDMLPARLGELSYVAMLKLGFKVRTDACLSSLALSFVFDLIALAFLLLAMIGYQLFLSGVELWLVVTLVILLIICGLFLLILFPVLQQVSEHLTGRFDQKDRPESRLGRIQKKLIHLIQDTSDSVQSAAQQGVIGQVLLLSLGVRVAKYTGLYLLFCGVVASSFTDITRNVTDVVIALISAEAGAGLPIPTFMSFGTYEAGGTLALIALGVSKASSVVVMLALHIWSQVIDYAFGIGATVFFALYILDLNLFFKDTLSSFSGAGQQNINTRQKKNWKALAYVLVLFLAGVFFLGFQFWKTQKKGWLYPPSPGTAIALPSTAAQKTSPVFDELHGFVIWSSNRFGNHDLVMLTLPDLKLSRLTNDLHTEFFPRISPNGDKVLFCRSQEPWVSQRNKFAWDTWILDLSTGTTRLLAKNALTPTWSSDGEKVYFLRQANQFVEYTLANQKETVVFETGKDDLSLSASIQLETPVWSEAEQALAVTLRGGARGTFVIHKDKSIQQVGKGCQLNWAPDSSFLYLVDHAKAGGNAFFRVDPETLEKKLWFDAPGAFSHEYFPKVSNTGDMLVYGASTGGHEHDRADYEIFLWPIGTPMGNTARLSFHTGNDNWPDIYLY
ncbi:lysylphosphatidylglycerol synthase domain-containing protein [Candidatus Electrothrix sp.]|uniref:lysylphosphatidylglycerol synthase domain-containing protein n=1 Tax=Candidatus Electrothrix sp. TaxID=2170559 RepID=UPI0040570DFF